MLRLFQSLLAVLFVAATPLVAQEAKLLIAFASYRDRPKYPDIFFYEHDGVAKGKLAGSVQVPRSANASGHPSLSLDGRYCAFTHEIENKTSRIYCWDRTDQKLIDLPVINDPPPAQLGPSFSGDGAFIAFSAWNRPGGPGPGWHVFLYDKKAGKLADLPGLNGQTTDDRHPAISADGRFVAFTSNRKGGPGLTSVYLYDRKDSKLVDVSSFASKYTDLTPTLSADGNLIAFSSERPGGQGGRDIYLFDRGAGKLVDLPGLNSEAHEVSPALSPDGRYLMFVSERIDGEGDRDIYLYDRVSKKLLPTPGLNSAAEDFEPCIIAK